MKETNPILKVEHLRQYFNKDTFHAVDDISFEINKGEVFSLVGESGSGKTTTGRSIIKLYKLTGGRVYFKNKLINAGIYEFKHPELTNVFSKYTEPNLTLKDVKKIQNQQKFETKIQMIFQDPVSSLDPRMTVREIIAEGLRIQGLRNEKEIQEKIANTLLKVGLLPEYANRYPHEFSGGQRQRIGIARAIIMNPELIIADEPVSALDVSIKAQIINLLNDLKNDLGLTILFIAHDLSVVKYFSDKIAVMYAGKIVEMATSDELFEHPFHPYTKSLLSAIPLPDPEYEKKRKRILYNPKEFHDYSVDFPNMKEVLPNHFVYCNNAEERKILNKLQ